MDSHSSRKNGSPGLNGPGDPPSINTNCRNLFRRLLADIAPQLFQFVHQLVEPPFQIGAAGITAWPTGIARPIHLWTIAVRAVPSGAAPIRSTAGAGERAEVTVPMSAIGFATRGTMPLLMSAAMATSETGTAAPPVDRKTGVRAVVLAAEAAAPATAAFKVALMTMIPVATVPAAKAEVAAPAATSKMAMMTTMTAVMTMTAAETKSTSPAVPTCEIAVPMTAVTPVATTVKTAEAETTAPATSAGKVAMAATMLAAETAAPTIASCELAVMTSVPAAVATKSEAAAPTATASKVPLMTAVSAAVVTAMPATMTATKPESAAPATAREVASMMAMAATMLAAEAETTAPATAACEPAMTTVVAMMTITTAEPETTAPATAAGKVAAVLAVPTTMAASAGRAPRVAPIVAACEATPTLLAPTLLALAMVATALASGGQPAKPGVVRIAASPVATPSGRAAKARPRPARSIARSCPGAHIAAWGFAPVTTCVFGWPLVAGPLVAIRVRPSAPAVAAESAVPIPEPKEVSRPPHRCRWTAAPAASGRRLVSLQSGGQQQERRRAQPDCKLVHVLLLRQDFIPPNADRIRYRQPFAFPISSPPLSPGRCPPCCRELGC